MVPDPVLEFLVTAAALGAASLSRFGECLFCTVRAAWPSLIGNTASATLTVSSSPIVSGAVAAYGLPLAGVTITYHADTTAFQSGTTATDNKGGYYFIVTAGWSGLTTPSLTGYNFTPLKFERLDSDCGHRCYAEPYRRIYHSSAGNLIHSNCDHFVY